MIIFPILMVLIVIATVFSVVFSFFEALSQIEDIHKKLCPEKWEDEAKEKDPSKSTS